MGWQRVALVERGKEGRGAYYAGNGSLLFTKLTFSTCHRLFQEKLPLLTLDVFRVFYNVEDVMYQIIEW